MGGADGPKRRAERMEPWTTGRQEDKDGPTQRMVTLAKKTRLRPSKTQGILGPW